MGRPGNPFLYWLVLVGPFLAPPTYLAAVLYLQPASQLGEPRTAPWLNRLLYDDYDWTAITLRGLNAALGRSPGRRDDPCSDPRHLGPLAQALDDPPPSARQFFLEYPHATLLFFALAQRLDPRFRNPEVPDAVLDACYHRVVEHEPRNPRERALWGAFRTAIQCCEGAMAVCQLLLMAVLAAGHDPSRDRFRAVYLLALPAALYFALNRYDIVPALLTAAGLALLARRSALASGACFGAATLVKVYPVLMVPLVLRHLGPDGRKTIAWSLGFTAAAVVLALPPLLLWGPSATWAPYHFQLTRPPEALTIYGAFLPRSLAEPVWGPLRLGFVVLVGALLIRKPISHLQSLLARSAVLLITFVAVQVFYSPQWILWLLPFLVPLARRNVRILSLSVLLDLVTCLTFPVAFDRVGPLAHLPGLSQALMAALIACRFATLAALAVVLSRAEFFRASSTAAVIRQ